MAPPATRAGLSVLWAMPRALTRQEAASPAHGLLSWGSSHVLPCRSPRLTRMRSTAGRSTSISTTPQCPGHWGQAEAEATSSLHWAVTVLWALAVQASVSLSLSPGYSDIPSQCFLSN